MTKNEKKAMLIYKFILFNINGYIKEELEEMNNEEIISDGIYLGIIDFINGDKTNYEIYA